MPTVSELLSQAVQQLKQNESQADDANADAGLLLGHVLEKSSAWLMTWPAKEVSDFDANYFLKLVNKRESGTPLAYLLGEWGFMDFMLKVGPGVLVPRPETELLVELAADRIPQAANWNILDLGTGSGAIATALARLRPNSRVHAVERSQDAADIAQSNFDSLAPSVKLHWGSWFEPLAASDQFEIIASNPPYIAEYELELEYLTEEPQEALVAAEDGLADIAHIIENSRPHLKESGWLLIEHGYGQGDAAQKLFTAAGFKDVETVLDLNRLPRVTLGRWVN
jgi:release factor glutamine methyltransferase